jgi:hypothetical protein
MAKGRSKKGIVITIIVLVLTLLIVGSVVAIQNSSSPAETITENPADNTVEEEPPAETETTPPSENSEDMPAVDPESLSSATIEPMNIVVAYSKGIPGFEFAIKRTADKTEYVEFSSPGLVGTKCTNDSGAFASIIKSPSSPENESTLAETMTVDGTTYGLSLTDESCTANTELLKQYQDAFVNGFSQLKEIE